MSMVLQIVVNRCGGLRWIDICRTGKWRQEWRTYVHPTVASRERLAVIHDRYPEVVAYFDRVTLSPGARRMLKAWMAKRQLPLSIL
jgi:hypothetical protein